MSCLALSPRPSLSPYLSPPPGLLLSLFQILVPLFCLCFSLLPVPSFSAFLTSPVNLSFIVLLLRLFPNSGSFYLSLPFISLSLSASLSPLPLLPFLIAYSLIALFLPFFIPPPQPCLFTSHDSSLLVSLPVSPASPLPSPPYPLAPRLLRVPQLSCTGCAGAGALSQAQGSSRAAWRRCWPPSRR